MKGLLSITSIQQKILRNLQAQSSVLKVVSDEICWKKWWEGTISQHPGLRTLNAVKMPSGFDKSAEALLHQYDKEQIVMATEKFENLLWTRYLATDKPKENSSKIITWNNVETIKTKHNKWTQLLYDNFLTAIYLVTRSPAVYASTLRVLAEIKKLNSNFKPGKMLDFGSGTCSAVWAAHETWPDLDEYYCVEHSECMNDVARYILSGGKEDSEFMGIHIRPRIYNDVGNDFDIVVAAYALSELPSKNSRIEQLTELWKRTKEYLVIIETGNKAGYSIILEARELVNKDPNANILAPCPHKFECPMSSLSKAKCTFLQKYFIPNYSRPFFRNKDTHVRYEKFSYVVLQKYGKVSEPNWPRCINFPDHTKNRVECHFCTSNGRIEHVSINKDFHGRDMRDLAKKTWLGDVFPVQKPD